MSVSLVPPLAALPPYVFAELDRRKQVARTAGRTLLDLGIGSPDQPTPAPIVAALQGAAADPALHGYPPFRGHPRLLDAAARYVGTRAGTTFDPARELVALAGAKEGIADLLGALVGPGDVVLVPALHYPVYARAALMRGAAVAYVPMRADDGWQLDLDAIPGDVLARARVLIANYPNNPTGAITSPASLARLVDFARAHALLLVHDMAYAELAYDGHVPPSIFAVPGARTVAVEFHSCSKSFNMAGMRVGFVAGRPDALDALLAYRSNVGYGVSQSAQLAAAHAFDHVTTLAAPIVAEYARRRDAIYGALRTAGWDVTPPQAAMYAWLPLPEGVAPWDAVQHLIDDAGIVVTPGLAFGEAGARWFRISFVRDAAVLADAATRVAQSLATLAPVGAR
ncbi:MAG: aminotransferase class I/II-fold pyridoxal phosphate-dependent enzyme [Gemmatimonadaceae bacterium]|nr:aminotransferase class I/II-fold pyridoxal phosphate-dependent enzyme [Gemmatimonadaceae bacterium]